MQHARCARAHLPCSNAASNRLLQNETSRHPSPSHLARRKGMKRIALIAVLLVVTLAAYGSTKLTIEPSQMKDGETKTLVDGDKTITVHKSGDSLDIKIEGAGKTRTITLNNSGGDIHIFKGGDGD